MNAEPILSDQPHQWITHKGVSLCVLGTAHVSQKSADVVRDLIATDEFDAVAIELDEIRSLSDRVLVMFDGRIVGERSPETSENELGLLMAGVAEEEAA